MPQPTDPPPLWLISVQGLPTEYEDYWALPVILLDEEVQKTSEEFLIFPTEDKAWEVYRRMKTEFEPVEVYLG